MFSIEQKNVFITGAGRGIGLSIAIRLIEAGARVVISDIADATEAAKEIGAVYVPIDVTDENSVADALAAAEQAIGRLDIVINNAGGALRDAPVTEENYDNYSRTLKINTDGVFFGMKHAPDHMNDGGSIINTASLAANYAISEYMSYSAAKAAVIAMSRTAAQTLGARGIRVNCVLPGTHATPSQPADGLEAHLCRKLAPLGTTGELEDLAGVYHFLSSPESRFITGQALTVDGGWGIGLAPAALESLVADFEGEKQLGYTGDFE